jgi:WD40 repeat protein
MSQSTPDHQLQEQDNLIKDTTVGRDLVFAPVQIGTKIETQIVQISVSKVTQQPLIKSSPYKGLKRFNVKDRDRFFGRDKLIARLLDAVNRSNLSLVLGASGSGKSSVVRAGLIPEIEKSLESQTFYDFIFTPNQDPFDSLYRCLLSEEKDYSFRKAEAEIAKEAKADTLPKVISRLRKNEERWLIFVDQFEELFTICDDPGKRKNFVTGLVQIAKSKNSFVKIVLAMRSDFLEQFSFYPDLGAIANQNNIHLVTEMYPDELRQAIEQPAAKHGVVFEEGLVEQIIKEVEGQKGYLPLLQYTLNLLWENECNTPSADGRFEIEDRTLNEASYRALEGVRGALQNRVNGIYRNLNQDEQTSTKQMFLKLVNIVDTESGSKAVSRRAYRDEFVGESVEKLLEQFIDANLLVSSSNYSKPEELQTSDKNRLKQSATVEIAHEILLASWDKLKGWLAEEKEAIVQKNLLASEVRRWQETLLKDKLNAQEDLLKGSRLAQVVEFRDKDAFQNLGGLSEQEEKFINTSVEEKERLQQRDLKIAQDLAEANAKALQEAEKREEEQKKANKKLIYGSIFLGFVSFVAIGVGVLAWQKTQQAELNQAESLGRYAVSLVVNEHRDLDAFVQAIKAGRILQTQHTTNPIVVNALQEALSNQTEQNRLIGHKDVVWSVAISNKGKTLVSGSGDNTIKVWDLEKGVLLHTLQGHKGGVWSVAISPDGKTLFSGGKDKTIKIWDLEKGGDPRTLQGHTDGIWSLVISPDGKTLFSGSKDKTIKIWNLEKGGDPRTLQGHTDWVKSLALSADGKTLVSGSYDETIKVWDLEKGGDPRTLRGHKSSVTSLSLSADGKTLVSSSFVDNTIKIWNLEKGGDPEILEDNTYGITSVALSPDGKTLVFAGQDNTINTIKVWDLGNEVLLNTFQGHTDAVKSLALSNDGKTLVSGSQDITIKVWNLKKEREPLTLQGHTGTINRVARKGDSVVLSDDRKTLVSGGGDNTIKVWNLEKGGVPRTLQGHTDWVKSLALSADGKTLVSDSYDATIKVWDLEKGGDPRILRGHKSPVTSLSLSADGKTLVSGSDDKTIKIWDLEKGGDPRTLQGHTAGGKSLALSADGKTLVSGGDDKTIKVWDLEKGGDPRTFQGHQHSVLSLFLSVDNKTLVSGSGDNTIKIWDLERGVLLNTLRGHTGWVNSVALSRDGKILVSGSFDGTIKVWDFDLDSLMAKSCDWVRVYLHNPNSDVRKEDRGLCDGI